MNIEDLNKKDPEFNPKEIIMKMGHIVEIIEASPEDIKIAYDTEKAILKNPKCSGLEDLLIKGIPGYLSASTFLDDFENHSDRRKWRMGLSNHSMEVFDFYERNKIANHSIRNFIQAFGLLSQIKDFDTDLKLKVEEIKERVIPATPKYDSLTTEEKLEVVSSLTDLVRQVCNEIIK